MPENIKHQSKKNLRLSLFAFRTESFDQGRKLITTFSSQEKSMYVQANYFSPDGNKKVYSQLIENESKFPIAESKKDDYQLSNLDDFNGLELPKDYKILEYFLEVWNSSENVQYYKYQTFGALLDGLNQVQPKLCVANVVIEIGMQKYRITVSKLFKLL